MIQATSPTMKRRSVLTMLALPVLLAASALVSEAADVRDNAGVFSASAMKSATSVLSQIERDSKFNVTIETVDSLNGRNIDSVLPDRARSLNARGLFVLYAKKEGKIETMVSREYAKYFPTRRLHAIRDVFVEEFRKRQFDQGLTKGVESIDLAVSQAKSEAGGSLNPTPVPNRRAGNAPAQAPARKGTWGMGSILGIVVLVFAGFLVIRLISGIFGGGRNAYGPGPGMMGGPGRGMGGPGPGYGPGYGGGGYGGGGGGGGFMSSLFGGIGGAMAGNWLYDRMSGGRHHDTTSYDQGVAPAGYDQPQGADWVGGDGGADVGGGDTGGDWVGGGGGGADVGGGDWGGGGGDGGGDWGGGGGGGDWGGGGSDNGGSW